MRKRGNILVIFLITTVVILSLAIAGYLFVQNKQLQNQKIQPVPTIQNSAPTNNFPTPIPTPVSTPAPTIDPTVNQKTKFSIVNDTYHCKDGSLVMAPNECSPSETRQ